MAITTDQQYLLNKKMGGVAQKVQLGDLIKNAETGGLGAGSVDTAELAADAVTGDKIEDNAVSLEHLDSGIEPSHVVKFAGEVTTVGGAAAEDFAVVGALATDLVFVNVKTNGAVPVTVVNAEAGVDKITVTFSADPSSDHVIQYMVIRVAA